MVTTTNPRRGKVYLIVVVTGIFAAALGGCFHITPEPAATPSLTPAPTPGETAPIPAETTTLVYGSGSLGESISTAERDRMFPRIEEEDVELPLDLHDLYYGESFFLEAGQEARLSILTTAPACFWEDDLELEAAVLIGIGPSMEHQKEWEDIDIDWFSAAKSFRTERCAESEPGDPCWITTLIFESPVSNYYGLCLFNLTKDFVEFEYNIDVGKT